MADAILQHQADAFAKEDPYAAGTALYPNVGPPVPIGDFDGRIAQSRKIATLRNASVAPWSTDEFAAAVGEFAKSSPAEREAILKRVNAFPEDVREPLVNALNAQSQEPSVMSDASEEPPREGAQYAQAGSGNTRMPRVQPLTPRQLMEIDMYRSKMDVIRRLEPENEFAKQPSVRAPESPMGEDEMRKIDEELGAVQARAAERDLRREEEAHGEQSPGPRPSTDELVQSTVPGGIVGRSPSGRLQQQPDGAPPRLVETEAERELAETRKKYILEEDTPNNRRIPENLNTPVEQFTGLYRAARIWQVLPSNLRTATVREVLESGNSQVRKLLLQERFGK